MDSETNALAVRREHNGRAKMFSTILSVAATILLLYCLFAFVFAAVIVRKCFYGHHFVERDEIFEA